MNSKWLDIGKDAVIATTAGVALGSTGATSDPGTLAALLIVIITALTGVVRHIIHVRRRKRLNTVLLEQLEAILNAVANDPQLIETLANALESMQEGRNADRKAE